MRGKVLAIVGMSSVALENRVTDLLFIQCTFCGDQIICIGRLAIPSFGKGYNKLQAHLASSGTGRGWFMAVRSISRNEQSCWM